MSLTVVGGISGSVTWSSFADLDSYAGGLSTLVGGAEGAGKWAVVWVAFNLGGTCLGGLKGSLRINPAEKVACP